MTNDRYRMLPDVNLGSPDSGYGPYTSPPFNGEETDASTPRSWRFKVQKFFKDKLQWRRQEPTVTSGYLTLIPLSDSRLRPQRTDVVVAFSLLLAVAAALMVFFLVPRGVSNGEIHVQSDRMSWNTTKGTYQLNLMAKLPVFNPNYLEATVHGTLKVLFYDAEAGSEEIKPMRVAARSSAELTVYVDASNVPSAYALTILSQCGTFPKRVIFFIKGHLTAQYLGQTQELSPIDSYFMINCVNGGTVPMPAPKDDDDEGRR